MQDTINQAVLFTKPVHHLGLQLTPEELDGQVQAFFKGKGFRMVFSQSMTGPSLAERDAIKQHYLMYSEAACIRSVEELGLSDEAISRFESTFGKSWTAESGKVLGSPTLQRTKGISSHELYLLWNDRFSNRETCKLQDGVIVAWLEDQDCYCVNAFYPAMEENFYSASTKMAYHVVEFDPRRVSWSQFRRDILGVTDASKADPGSFRGQLYAAHAVEFPGRDNFVHGSAGPLEGLIERMIHEPEFDMTTNPVGRHLLSHGVTLDRFQQWKNGRSISQLGEIYDATEEKDTLPVLDILDTIRF